MSKEEQIVVLRRPNLNRIYQREIDYIDDQLRMYNNQIEEIDLTDPNADLDIGRELYDKIEQLEERKIELKREYDKLIRVSERTLKEKTRRRLRQERINKVQQENMEQLEKFNNLLTKANEDVLHALQEDERQELLRLAQEESDRRVEQELLRLQQEQLERKGAEGEIGIELEEEDILDIAQQISQRPIAEELKRETFQGPFMQEQLPDIPPPIPPQPIPQPQDLPGIQYIQNLVRDNIVRRAIEHIPDIPVGPEERRIARRLRAQGVNLQDRLLGRLLALMGIGSIITATVYAISNSLYQYARDVGASPPPPPPPPGPYGGLTGNEEADEGQDGKKIREGAPPPPPPPPPPEETETNATKKEGDIHGKRLRLWKDVIEPILNRLATLYNVNKKKADVVKFITKFGMEYVKDGRLSESTIEEVNKLFDNSKLSSESKQPLVDIIKETKEKHLFSYPRYNYLGPGTNLKERLTSAGKYGIEHFIPINNIDNQAMLHDIYYEIYDPLIRQYSDNLLYHTLTPDAKKGYPDAIIAEKIIGAKRFLEQTLKLNLGHDLSGDPKLTGTTTEEEKQRVKDIYNKGQKIFKEMGIEFITEGRKGMTDEEGSIIIDSGMVNLGLIDDFRNDYLDLLSQTYRARNITGEQKLSKTEDNNIMGKTTKEERDAMKEIKRIFGDTFNESDTIVGDRLRQGLIGFFKLKTGFDKTLAQNIRDYIDKYGLEGLSEEDKKKLKNIKTASKIKSFLMDRLKGRIEEAKENKAKQEEKAKEERLEKMEQADEQKRYEELQEQYGKEIEERERKHEESRKTREQIEQEIRDEHKRIEEQRILEDDIRKRKEEIKKVQDAETKRQLEIKLKEQEKLRKEQYKEHIDRLRKRFGPTQDTYIVTKEEPPIEQPEPHIVSGKGELPSYEIEPVEITGARGDINEGVRDTVNADISQFDIFSADVNQSSSREELQKIIPTEEQKLQTFLSDALFQFIPPSLWRDTNDDFNVDQIIKEELEFSGELINQAQLPIKLPMASQETKAKVQIGYKPMLANDRPYQSVDQAPRLQFWDRDQLSAVASSWSANKLYNGI